MNRHSGNPSADPSQATDRAPLEETVAHDSGSAASDNPAAGGDPRPRPANCGRYLLDKFIGKGGFAEVWLGYDPQLKRPVAIKIPRADRRQHADLVRRFLEEGQKAAALNCPGAVQVYDVGTDADCPFIVSEFKEGGHLGKRLASDPPSPEEAARLLAEVADALHQAHLKGLVHRDVKPENILLDAAGRPFLADFGLATTEREQLGEESSTVGTWAYMSPEQVRGESHRVDARTDVYSLGVILYRMLTGRLPYLADTADEYRDQILHREPRPPRTIDDSIPPELEAVCLKCLSKDVAQRYSTASDVARQLRDGLPGRPSSRRRLALAGAGGLLLAGAIAVLVLFGGRGGAKDDDGRGEGQPPPTDSRRTNAADGQPSPAPQRDGLLLPDLAALPALPLEEVQWKVADVGTWEIPRGSNTVRAIADDLVILVAGRYDGGELDFSVEVRPKSTACRAGIFFGYGRADDRRIALQTVGFARLDSGTDKLESDLHWFSSAGSTHPSRARFASIDLPQRTDAPQALAVKLRDGDLAAIVPESLSKQLLQQRAVAIEQFSVATSLRVDGRGLFGIWCTEGTVTFSNPVLNGEQVRFAVKRD